jgi:hypothetical protein
MKWRTGRPRKRQRNHVEGDSKIMRFKKRLIIIRDSLDGGRIYWKPKSTRDCSAGGGGRGGGGGGGGKEEEEEEEEDDDDDDNDVNRATFIKYVHI